jgi:hypothetical protein
MRLVLKPAIRWQHVSRENRIKLRTPKWTYVQEISGDAAERLIHAFKKDGIHDHENIYGPKPRKWAARKDVRVRES